MRNLLIIAFLVVLAAPLMAAVGPNWIEQWGITWTFDKNVSTNGVAGTYHYGTYANGDYWIVGPVNIISITPAYKTVSGRIMNGSMINPTIGCSTDATPVYQGYDSAADSWNANVCVNSNVSAGNPLNIAISTIPIRSLVSTISTDTVNPNGPGYPRLKTAAILTVVASAPNTDAFRPPYAGNVKPSEIRASSMDLVNRGFANLVPTASAPTFATAERWIERVWLHQVTSWMEGSVHPTDNCEMYGRDMARQINDIVLLLNTATTGSKTRLINLLVQNAIDIYGAVLNNRLVYFHDGGGRVGRLLQFVVAAHLLDHSGMKAVLLKSGQYRFTSVNAWGEKYWPNAETPDLVGFGEQDQTHYVTQADVDITHNTYVNNPRYPDAHYYTENWTPNLESDWNTPGVAYTTDDIGMPEWGIRHSSYPKLSNASFVGAGYRGTAASCIVGEGLAAQIMGITGLFNNPALIDYADRHMGVLSTFPNHPDVNHVKVANRDPYDWYVRMCIGVNSPGQFTTEMWNAYRANYGPIWPNTGTAPTTYALSVNAANGTVTKKVSGVTTTATSFSAGTVVELTAAPNTGYAFSNWTGDVTGTTNPVTVTMNANKSVTANFTQTTTTMPTDTVYQNTTEMAFSTATDYQEIPTTGWNLNGTTITLWVNPQNLTGIPYLFGHTVGSWANRIQLYADNGSLGLGLGDTHFRQNNLATLQTGQWTFISLSWNGTNYTVQVNGQVAGTGAYTGLTTLSSIADVGNDGNPTARTEGFAGTIDDIRIYGRALSTAETAALYAYGRTTAAPATYTLSTTTATGSITKKVAGVVTTATSFAAGTVVELTAAANAGYSFGSWTGDATGTTNPVTITMNGNKAVTANFTAIAYTLTTTATNGTVAKSPNTATYIYGQVVTLTPTANTGYTFGSWTGDATGTTSPVTVTINGNKAVTANFTQLTYTLTTTATNGSVAKSPNTATYTYGQVVTLTPTANAGYSFGSWSGDATGTANPVTITMNGNKAVTANFTAATYTLTTTATNGTVTKSPSTATYTYGQVVTLTPTANAGYSFGSWTGDATGTTNPVTVTMNGNKAVTANFTQNTYTLTITATNGTVAKSPNTATYTYGQVVTLTATANAGYSFGSWTGDATGTTNPVTITINGNKAVTANFTQLALADGLTAHWMLDEATGIAAIDCTAAQLSANIVGTPDWGFGWADEDWVALNSTTEALAIPATTVTTQAGSIAIWLEPQDLSGTKFILGHVYNSANRLSLYTVAGKLAVGLGSNAALLTDIATLTIGQPAHLVLTWNGTAYAIFVNGQQKAAGTFSGLTALNTTIDVGNYGDPASRTLGMIGSLDDVRTYNRAISAAEVATLYQTYDAKQHKTVEFTIAATTAQGVPIVYNAVLPLPTEAQFNVATQTLSWQPWYNQSGNYTIQFTAAGQPNRIVTVSVHAVTLNPWYYAFLSDVKTPIKAQAKLQ